jgi:hypothetical protein
VSGTPSRIICHLVPIFGCQSRLRTLSTSVAPELDLSDEASDEELDESKAGLGAGAAEYLGCAGSGLGRAGAGAASEDSEDSPKVGAGAESVNPVSGLDDSDSGLGFGFHQDPDSLESDSGFGFGFHQDELLDEPEAGFGLLPPKRPPKEPPDPLEFSDEEEGDHQLDTPDDEEPELPLLPSDEEDGDHQLDKPDDEEPELPLLPSDEEGGDHQFDKPDDEEPELPLLPPQLPADDDGGVYHDEIDPIASSASPSASASSCEGRDGLGQPDRLPK